MRDRTVISPRKKKIKKSTKNRFSVSLPCLKFWYFSKLLLTREASDISLIFLFFFLLKLAFENIAMFQQMAQFSLKLLVFSLYLGKFQSYLRLFSPLSSIRFHSMWLMKFCEKINLDYLPFFLFTFELKVESLVCVFKRAFT